MTLEVRNVTAGYGNITVLRDLSLTVADGGILGVLGRNGMGKTTLIRCLAGLIIPDAGTITLHGPVAGRAIRSIAVPLELIDGSADCVRIEAASVTVQAVLAALLRKLGRGVWEPGAVNRKVTTVLMEAGGEEETVRAARLRSDHPAARLVAVGAPRTAGLFDAVCPQPVTAEALAAALSAAPEPHFEVS